METIFFKTAVNKVKKGFYSAAKNIYAWIIFALFLQSVAGICSFPFLIYHGMPISNFSTLGNLVFNPILVCFMFLAAIIFFTNLIGLKGLVFINMLEQVTTFWIKGLYFFQNQASYLVSVKQGCCIAILIFCCFFVGSFFKSIQKISIKYKTIFAYLMLLLCSQKSSKKYFDKLFFKNRIFTFKIKNKLCGAFFKNDEYDKLILIAEKDFFKMMRSKNFIEYSLKPVLARNCGCVNFDFDKNNYYNKG